MKRPRAGSLFLLLTSDELLARIATLVPPPRVHGLRYHGVFAPRSKVRGRVVPAPEPAAPVVAPLPRKSAGKPGRPERSTEGARTYRIPWAELLAKVFAVDVLACPECGGRMQLIAFIAEPTIAKRILDHMGHDSTGPPLAPPRVGQPDLVDPAPAYDVTDPVYEE
jgi:Putative transposase